MIDLNTQDQVDNSNKVAELRAAIGTTFSDNHSSTYRSRLVSVSADGKYCTTDEVEAWGKPAQKSGVKVASWLIWNAMFY